MEPLQWKKYCGLLKNSNSNFGIRISLMGIKELLQLVVDKEASDLHIITGIPPYIRYEGVLSPVANETVITPEIVERFVKEMFLPEQLERLSVNKEIDSS